jgi:two-component system OmpR family response regulator
MRLLYIDDDRINTLVFTETCRLVQGLEVAVAGTGAEAEEQAREWLPELLVIDLNLPDTDGIALLPRLRESCGATTPAYLCTADDSRAVREQATQAGFDGCWAKPVDLSALIGHLRRLAG